MLTINLNLILFFKKLEKGAGIPLKQLSRGDRVGGFGIHDKFGRQVVFPNGTFA